MSILLQVVLQATVGRGYQGDIAIDDVIFTDGLCENGSDALKDLLGTCSISTVIIVLFIFHSHYPLLLTKNYYKQIVNSLYLTIICSISTDAKQCVSLILPVISYYLFS